MNKKSLAFIKFLIGIVILSNLFYKIGFKSILTTMSEMELVYIVPIVIIIIATNFIGGLNLKILFSTFKINIPSIKLFRSYSLSWAISLFIPGRLGELSIIYFFKKSNISIGMASAAIILDKIISIIIVAFFAFIGLFIFLDKSQIIKIIAFFVLFIVFLIYSIFNEKIRNIIRMILGKYSRKFTGFSKSLFQMTEKGKMNLFLDFLLTITKWIISTSVIFFLFLSLNQKISFFDVLLLNSIISLISLIPISLSGLGIRESAAVLLFTKIGIKNEITASTYFAALIIKYIIAVLILVFFMQKSDFTAPNTTRK
jgi:hypothetical protein